MLPHYSAFKVAEQFRVLDALAPGRVDLGLGRAPGSDGRTAFALNPLANERPAQFPADIRDLLAWLGGTPLVDGHPYRQVQAFPQGDTVPEVWVLGSSDYGAQVAAHFGLPYCFAWFFSDGPGTTRCPARAGAFCATGEYSRRSTIRMSSRRKTTPRPTRPVSML